MRSRKSTARTQVGQSLDDLDETIGDLERQLALLEEEEASAKRPLFARWELLREGLARLQDYYARLPAETTRFSSDKAFLDQVRQVADRRIQLIEDLLTALARV